MANGCVDKPKIVLLDLETLPNLQEILKVWPSVGDYPGKTLRATITSIICVGYKVLDSKVTNCINAWDFPEWKRDRNNDKKLCQAIYEVLKDADAVVTHNGKRFDWKFLQTRLLLNGLSPLPNIPHIDTKELSSRYLFSYNNKLDYIGSWLVDERKLDNGGWSLWVEVHMDCNKAKNKMSAYCKQDVKLLEKIFKPLRPFANNIPNHNLFKLKDDSEKVCPNCGSQSLVNHGWRYTKTNTYMRLRCKDCHSFSRLSARKTLPRSI